MHFISYVFGVIVILVGIKTVITQEVTLSVQLWGNSSNNRTNIDGGYATSEHTGFIAILIGIVQIAVGVGLLIKGPAFFN